MNNQTNIQNQMVQNQVTKSLQSMPVFMNNPNYQEVYSSIYGILTIIGVYLVLSDIQSRKIFPRVFLAVMILYIFVVYMLVSALSESYIMPIRALFTLEAVKFFFPLVFFYSLIYSLILVSMAKGGGLIINKAKEMYSRRKV